MNGAVGELLGLINGYSYANGNPVNLTDPSGMCAQPTQWWNPVDVNCYYSADGLARRFSNGDPSLYQTYFNILIQKDWGELKYIEGVGSLNDLLSNASILPNLFYQNPQVALQALGQYLSGCGGNNIAYGTLLDPSRIPPQLLLGAGLVVGSIGIILALSTLAGALSGNQSTAAVASTNFDYETAKRVATEEIARRLANPVILFRGTAMSRVFNREGLYDNRLWVFREAGFFEAVTYAKNDGLLHNDTAAVAAYGMLEQTFNSLITSGNIRVRFGREYGLDVAAQASLVGPVVIPIPDLRHG